MPSQRVVVLAFSEASPQLIDKYCAAGLMPYLAELREKSAVGHTKYHVPFLLTPQMWATVFTSRSAGSHGIFDYWQRGADGVFVETHGSSIKGPTVWDAFLAQGVKSAVVNAPVTFPPPESCAFAISGQDAPGLHESMMHPRKLYRELEQVFGRYHHKDIFPGPYSKAEYGDVLHAEMQRQTDLFKHLVEREDWRFLLLYASGSAFAQHYFWSDIDATAAPDVVRRMFMDMDDMIRTVHQSMQPEDIFLIMSECGAGPLTQGVRLNRWLEQGGYLARTQAKTGWLARVLTAIRTAAPRFIPRRLFYLVNGSPLKRWVQEKITTDAIDWQNTRAYYRGKGEGNIYINLAGRDIYGIVAPQEYEALREEIIHRLSSLVDPATGKPAVRKVHKREDLFPDDHAAAPDLVVEWEEFQYMPAESLASSEAVFGPRIREYMSWPTTGAHRRKGYFLAAGKDIPAGKLEEPVDLRDLAPTWLDLLGASAPEGMEGRSIKPLLTGG